MDSRASSPGDVDAFVIASLLVALASLPLAPEATYWLIRERDDRRVPVWKARQAVLTDSRQGGCMRHWVGLMAALAGAGCGDPTPTSTIGDSAPRLDNVLVPPIVFNTQMRSALEVPACASASQGHAQVKILQDGTIEAVTSINNKGGESVRFGHIHHLDPGQATGPIIWWLTTPIGVDLDLIEQHIDVRQPGVFVANPHFTTAELALAELLSDPASFYVNFHSDVCPGGFARGFLP